MPWMRQTLCHHGVWGQQLASPRVDRTFGLRVGLQHEHIHKRYFVILANIEAFTVLFQAVVDHPVPERPATAKRAPNPWLSMASISDWGVKQRPSLRVGRQFFSDSIDFLETFSEYTSGIPNLHRPRISLWSLYVAGGKGNPFMLRLFTQTYCSIKREPLTSSSQ